MQRNYSRKIVFQHAFHTTHLAFYFHGVHVQATQRLRFINVTKAPVHFARLKLFSPSRMMGSIYKPVPLLNVQYPRSRCGKVSPRRLCDCFFLTWGRAVSRSLHKTSAENYVKGKSAPLTRGSGLSVHIWHHRSLSQRIRRVCQSYYGEGFAYEY